MSDTHAPSHGQPQVPGDTPDPKSLTVTLIGLISAVLVLVIILLLQAFWYYLEDQEYQRKVVQQAPAELTQQLADQNGALNSAAVENKATRAVRIPIADAMARTQQRLADEQKKHANDAPPKESGAGTGHNPH